MVQFIELVRSFIASSIFTQSLTLLPWPLPW